jgi:hypothetical protein
MPAVKIKNLPEKPEIPPPPGVSKFSKAHANATAVILSQYRNDDNIFTNGPARGFTSNTHFAGDDPHKLAGEKSLTIKQILNRVHNEDAPPAVVTAFQKYWPGIKRMTMKEAWLRIVYMEAIGGAPWATQFIANRTEGLVGTGYGEDNKGSILAAINKELQHPV